MSMDSSIPEPTSPSQPDASENKMALARALRWLTLMLLPTTAVLIGLVIFGDLTAPHAGLAWLAVVGLSVLLGRRALMDLSRLYAFVRKLSQGQEIAPPEIHSNGAAATMALALAQLRRDIRQAQQAAENSVQSYEAMFDALPDAVLILDTLHQVVRVNAAARALFGSKLVGRHVSAFVRHPAILEALESHNQLAKELDYTVPVPVERRFTVTIQPIQSDLAIGASVLISFHDITTIRRLEQMRADFVANASHELRTPLSSLIGFIETLQGPAKDDPEAQERFLKIMLEQSARMARLIEDLLSLSRIELNEHTQPSHAVDVRQPIRTVIEGLEPKASQRKVSVTVTAEEPVPMVRGEIEELTQVFQNLIENAVKYTLDETDVHISIAALPQGPVNMPKTSQGPVVAVAVRDHGEGIAQDHIPRLTERFYRVDSARSRQMGGTGLGLAIVKHVINRHRGVLSIDSTVGQGSVFTVYLPVANETDA